MENDSKKTLYGKLLEIRKSVPYLQKASKNQGQGFQYVSSSQVLNSVREQMDSKGLLLVPSIEGQEVEHLKTPKGGNRVFTKLDMIMLWVDVETEETLACKWKGQGVDDHEKGIGKALTYAEKYFILKFFNIPTDRDDPDAWVEKNEQGSSKEGYTPPSKGTPTQTVEQKITKAMGEGIKKADSDDKWIKLEAWMMKQGWYGKNKEAADQIYALHYNHWNTKKNPPTDEEMIDKL